jgi:hypothetical protein
MRHATNPLLPEEVRRRTGKADLGLMIPQALAAFGRARLDAVMLAGAEAVEPYVDLTAVRRAYHRYLTGGARDDAMTVWRVAALTLWLRHTRLNPAPVNVPAVLSLH